MAGLCVHMNGEAASPRFLKLWLKPGLFSTNIKTLADRRYVSYSIHLHGIWHD
jgi:hypothetical protein